MSQINGSINLINILQNLYPRPISALIENKCVLLHYWSYFVFRNFWRYFLIDFFLSSKSPSKICFDQMKKKWMAIW